MNIPQLKFSVRSMMIAVAIAAVASVAFLNLYDFPERRARYIQKADSYARAAASHQAKVDRFAESIDRYLEQIRADEPPAPGNPSETNEWRERQVESLRVKLDLNRSLIAVHAERERKYRRAARWPWLSLFGGP